MAETPLLPSSVINDASESAEISEHGIVVDEKIKRTMKPPAGTVEDAAVQYLCDPLFSVKESQLPTKSLAKLVCPVNDYKFFEVDLDH